tara:strand:- start:302 stop:1489 length:1188 start_codon:yes stop_codon:yes gene_type:complete
MSRLILILFLSIFSAQAIAAESISPRMAQRVLMILDRAEEDPEQALTELRELIDSRSEDSRDRGYILYERAALLVQHEQIELARQEVSEALVGQSDDYVPRLRFLLGQLHLMSNDPAAALEQLNIWLAVTDAALPGELAMVGYTNLQLEHYEEAAAMLERAIAAEGEPQNQWLELLAFCYTQIGRSEDAVALMERIITEQPAQARWWRQLASIYLLLENVPKGAAGLAVSSLVEELELNEAKSLAKLFNMLGMPSDGAEVLTTSMESHPDLVGFDEHMLLGELWMLAREFDFAVRAFELAATLDSSGEAHWRLGQLYVQREEYIAAQAALADAIAGYGEDVPPQAYYLLAIVAINLADFDTASTAIMRIQDDADYARRAEQLDAYINQALTQGQE